MSMRQLKITKSITNRESQSLDKYLQEIGKVIWLPKKKYSWRCASVKAIGGAGQVGQSQFPFGGFVAKQYQNQDLPPDLINEEPWLIKAALRLMKHVVSPAFTPYGGSAKHSCSHWQSKPCLFANKWVDPPTALQSIPATGRNLNVNPPWRTATC